MKKASEVFKSIRFAKNEPRGKAHKSTDDEGHYTVGEKEFNQQLQHVKKMAMQEEIKKMDVPAYLRKQKGEKPLTMNDVKSPRKDSISAKENLAKARNEEVEQLGESGGDVVYKKGDHHIEKYGEDSFALYKDGKKQKFYTSIEAAKSAMNEEVEQIDEKNVPTSPEKWAQAKAQAKAKFDVYPSAYANGWAAKKYKAMGGGWKSVSEESQVDEGAVPAKEKTVTVRHKTSGKELVVTAEKAKQLKQQDYYPIKEAVKDKFDIGEYDQEGDMAKSDLRSIIANAKRVHDMLEDSDNLPEWVQSKITKAEDYMSTVANYMASEMTEQVNNQNPPFDPDPPKKKSVVAGKYGVGYSTAKHLARQAMQKQVEKMKKPVKEETSMKAKIVKDVMKKKKEKVTDDSFQKDPIISNSQVKM